MGEILHAILEDERAYWSSVYRRETVTGWKLTRRGDYINGDLANRTRAAVVALERSGLWSFVVRDRATGEDLGSGRELSDRTGGDGRGGNGSGGRAG